MFQLPLQISMAIQDGRQSMHTLDRTLKCVIPPYSGKLLTSPTELRRPRNLAATTTQSVRERKAMEDLEALGGMQRPDRSVESKAENAYHCHCKESRTTPTSIPGDTALLVSMKNGKLERSRDERVVESVHIVIVCIWSSKLGDASFASVPSGIRIKCLSNQIAA